MSAFQVNQKVSVVNHFHGWKAEGKVITVSARKVEVRFFHPQFQTEVLKDFTTRGEEYGVPNRELATRIKAIEA